MRNVRDLRQQALQGTGGGSMKCRKHLKPQCSVRSSVYRGLYIISVPHRLYSILTTLPYYSQKAVICHLSAGLSLVSLDWLHFLIRNSVAAI